MAWQQRRDRAGESQMVQSTTAGGRSGDLTRPITAPTGFESRPCYHPKETTMADQGHKTRAGKAQKRMVREHPKPASPKHKARPRHKPSQTGHNR